MQFLMLIYRDREPVPEAGPSFFADVDAWVKENDASGVRLAGGPLAADGDTVAVRVRDGGIRVDHGGFLDTGSALIGYDVLNCRDEDEAVAVAAAHPMAARFVLELRAMVDG
jgi:hypothetical protein